MKIKRREEGKAINLYLTLRAPRRRRGDGGAREQAFCNIIKEVRELNVQLYRVHTVNPIP